MSQISVVQLLHGSAELDRMRREINQLVGMVYGLAKTDPAFKTSQTLKYRYKDGTMWHVEKFVFGPLAFQYRSQSGAVIYDTDNKEELKYKNVLEVHEKLQDFLNLMISHSETLMQKLEPILKAASRNYDST